MLSIYFNDGTKRVFSLQTEERERLIRRLRNNPEKWVILKTDANKNRLINPSAISYIEYD